MSNQEDVDLTFNVEIDTTYDQISERQMVVFVKGNGVVMRYHEVRYGAHYDSYEEIAA